MKKNRIDSLQKVGSELSSQYEGEKLLCGKDGLTLPDRSVIIHILRDIRTLIFPGYFTDSETIGRKPQDYIDDKLFYIARHLREQIMRAKSYEADKTCAKEKAEQITLEFFDQLPRIQRLLLKDVEAGYEGDPAAMCRENVIISYPGLYAIYVYRLAHELYIRNVPYIPRIMTEFSHSRTGIDINAGATIGEYFFIDHGTGVVVGETTHIGDHVKLYQGVTLGALSTRKGQALNGIKRHPTIEDNVTIYANATILGGETVIGHDSVISGNSFIISSVPAGTKVSTDLPTVRYAPQYNVQYYGDNI